MKNIAVLILAFGCCVCKVAARENDDVCQRSGSTGRSDTSSLTSMSQTLGVVGEKVANMAEKMTLLEAKLLNAEREVLELRSLTAGKPQVAFSVALRESGSGDIGPFTIDTPLKYKKVFSNTGNGYNPSTGIFTALVSGTYFFRFSMQSSLIADSVVYLKKNTERLVTVLDITQSETETQSTDSGSNAVVIALQVGDGVYVELEAKRKVYDDADHYNTFTGFLLFAA